jgi:hypothetical protein
MKANELRLGNWVYYDGRDCSIQEPTDLIDADEFKPIQLNEDWLVKFGFKKETIYYSIDILPFATEYKKLVVDIFQGILIRNGDEDKGRFNDELITLHNCDVRDKIYVHQLQNLYFALVGKELTINE